MRKTSLGVSIAALLVLGTFGLARAQTEAQGQAAHGSHGQMGAMMDECKTMMSAREQMKSEMESAQAELDTLVESMNDAEGDAKVAAMAEVVAALASQRKSMMSTMMTMQPQMMQHMMRHMRMAMEEGGETSMACPMMKEMGDHEKGPSSH